MKKKKIAFIHRYGLEGWICCGGHAVPKIIETLSAEAVIHFYGPKTTEPEDPELRAKLVMHELPYTWNRANPSDKITKTIPWYFWLPIIGLRCRLNGVRLIWNEETVPFTAPILRLFYGRNIAITVMDFFARIYTDKHPRLHWLRDLVEWIDLQSWKKLPVIFTHVEFAKKFLTDRGVQADRIHVVPNPCDHSKFHPVDDTIRKATRDKLGFTDSDIVLSHHGILHPNKGNGWILQRLAEVKDDLPHLKFLLIGNGPEFESLQKMASDLGIADRVVLTGWLASEKELNEALASSDIGLVMRIGQETDHFHMTDTLNHEMACGKPILAVHLNGIAEFIHDGENGFLFSPDKPEEFRTKVIHLANDQRMRHEFAVRVLELSRTTSAIDHCAAKACSALGTLLRKTETKE
jgi:glycosyltransferase involved in cell wall biosynthesis